MKLTRRKNHTREPIVKIKSDHLLEGQKENFIYTPSIIIVSMEAQTDPQISNSGRKKLCACIFSGSQNMMLGVMKSVSNRLYWEDTKSEKYVHTPQRRHFCGSSSKKGVSSDTSSVNTETKKKPKTSKVVIISLKSILP